MRVLVVLLVCLPAACLAQAPKPCTSPPLLSGGFSVVSNARMPVVARYSYDALGKRIRLREFESLDNKPSHHDVLLLYGQSVMYKINNSSKTCSKKPLSVDFHPLEVPQNAFPLGPATLGSSSGPGQGLQINSWIGEMQLKNETARYSSSVTEVGCIPVSSMFFDKSGLMVTSFFNNAVGQVDPQEFIPPKFCEDAELEQEDGEDPATFFSVF